MRLSYPVWFRLGRVRVIKADGEQSGELRDRPNIFDIPRSQPGLNFPKALGRDDEGAMLHGTDGVAVAGWFFALRDLEEGEKAVITHIEEVMAHLLIGRVAAIAGTGTKTGRYLHRMDERHTEDFDVEVDRRLHVVSAKRKVVDAPGCR